MQNITFNSGYNISQSRLQTLTTPKAIAWPSIMHALTTLSLALDNYQQNPENNQVRATFIQTVNQVLTSNAIIRDYFEGEKGYGYYMAKIFKAEPSSWGKSNSYVAKRFADISQILIDNYQIKRFIEHGCKPKPDYKFQLHQFRTPPALLDYYYKTDNARFLFKKQAKHNRELGLWVRSEVSLSKQIQMLTKYNLKTVRHGHIRLVLPLDLQPESIPLTVAPLGKELKSKLHNLTKLTFAVVADELYSYQLHGVRNQLKRLVFDFWHLIKQNKQLTTVEIDISKANLQGIQQLKLAATALKYLNNLTTLNLKLQKKYNINKEEIADLLRNLKGLTKLASLNFKRVDTYKTVHRLPNLMSPILGTISSLTNLSQLVINIRQFDFTSEELKRLSQVILLLPKLSVLALHMGAFKPRLGDKINYSALTLFIQNLNLSTSLTTLRLIMPENASSTISMFNALRSLKDSIDIELELIPDVYFLKSIVDSVHKFGAEGLPLKNLSQLNLMLGFRNLLKIDNYTTLPRDKLESAYYYYFKPAIGYCNFLPALKLEIPLNDSMTNPIILMLASLNHLQDLEIVIHRYHSNYEAKTYQAEFLPLLSHTLNNLPKLTSFKLTLDHIDDNNHQLTSFISSPSLHIKNFIIFIYSLNRLERFKLSLYHLVGKRSIEYITSGFQAYVYKLKTMARMKNSWYTLIASSTNMNRSSCRAETVVNYYF
jgi:hypothetical protein